MDGTTQTQQTTAQAATAATAAPGQQSLAQMAIAAAQGTSVSPPAAAGAAKPWWDGMPAELVTDKVRAFQSPADLVKAFNAAQGLIGRKQVVLGTDLDPASLTAEQRAQVQASLGRPEKPDGYQYTFPPELGEADKEKTAKFAEQAHALGLTQDQYQGVLKYYSEDVQAERARRDLETGRSLKQLQQDWGRDFAGNLADAGRAIQALDAQATLTEIDALNHPGMLRLFAKVGAMLREDTPHGAGGGAAPTHDAELAALTAHPAYRNASHPDHHKVVTRRLEVLAAKYANQK